MRREVHQGTLEAYRDRTLVMRYLDDYGEEYHAELARDFVKSLPGKRVLDLGCGPGHYVEYFSKLGCQTSGLDYSDEMIRAARSLDPTANLMVGDMRDVGTIYTPDSFEGVWANASILHIPIREIGEVLDGVARVLVNGGKFLLRTKGGPTSMEEIEGEFYGIPVNRKYTFWDEKKLIKKLKKHGFINISSVDERTDERIGTPKREIDWLQIHAEIRK